MSVKSGKPLFALIVPFRLSYNLFRFLRLRFRCQFPKQALFLNKQDDQRLNRHGDNDEHQMRGMVEDMGERKIDRACRQIGNVLVFCDNVDDCCQAARDEKQLSEHGNIIKNHPNGVGKVI